MKRKIKGRKRERKEKKKERTHLGRQPAISAHLAISSFLAWPNLFNWCWRVGPNDQTHGSRTLSTLPLVCGPHTAAVN
jgi:ribosomal protein S8E